MSEEKRKSEAAEKPPPKPDGSQPAAPERAAPKKPRTEREARRPEEARRASRRAGPKRRARAEDDGPGAARLFALVAGGLLALLGVLGFFYDATFGTGSDLSSDDLAGTLRVNGWRNVIYLVSGIAALAFAPRRARATALGLGLFYLVYAIWGFIVTERGIGSILDALPLGNDDNALHLAVGVLGTLAALVDGPLPKVPERLRPKRPKPKPRPKRKPKPAERAKSSAKPKPKGEKAKPARSGRGARRPGRAGPRPGDGDEPR